MMKKVLILAYDFPPYVSVGGLRPHAWYKYLKKYQVEPIIITRQWGTTFGNHLDYIAPSASTETIIEKSELGTIIRTPYRPNLANRMMLKYGKDKFQLIRRLITAFYEILQWVYPIGPKVQLYHEAKKYLKTHQVDAIMATGEPFILFRYASKLSKQFQIPWLADYRDPWIQNASRAKNKLLEKWYRYWEKKCLQNVYAITTVSTLFQKQIASLIKGKNFHILPNGYDNEHMEAVQHIKPNRDRLMMAFMGSVYHWHPIQSFLEVCWQFVKQQESIKFQLNFYGVSATPKIKALLESDYYATPP